MSQKTNRKIRKQINENLQTDLGQKVISKETKLYEYQQHVYVLNMIANYWHDKYNRLIYRIVAALISLLYISLVVVAVSL